MISYHIILIFGLLFQQAQQGQILQCNIPPEKRLDALAFRNVSSTRMPQFKPRNFSLHISYIDPDLERFDTKTNLLRVGLSFMLLWHDDRVRWSSPSRMQFEKYQLWMPVIKTLNEYSVPESVQEKYLSLEEPIVSSAGSVSSVLLESYASYCSPDLRAYPFDTHNCTLTLDFENVKRSEAELYRYNHEPTSLDNEWTILMTQFQTAESMSAKLCQEPHLRMRISLLLRRNWRMHVHTYIVPSIVLLLTTLALLWVPHPSNQRFCFAFGVSFGLILLSSFCSRVFPAGLGTSTRLVSCLLYNYFLLFTIFLASIFTCNLHSRSPTLQAVPPALRAIFSSRVLNLLTFMPRQPHHSSDDQATTTATDLEVPSGAQKVGLLLKELKRQQEVKRALGRDNEWKRTATMLDRLLFHFLSLLTLICLLVFYA